MINHYNVVSGSWTQITQAGQSGVQGGVLIKYIDLHYQIDTDGSFSEYEK